MSPVEKSVSGFGGTVDLTAEAAVVEQVVRLVQPFYTVWGSPPSSNARVLACGTPSGPGWERVVVPAEQEPSRELIVDPVRRWIAIAEGREDWRVQQVLRSIRHLLRWEAYSRGDLLLHGGMVRLGGYGVAIVGQKRAGKSSTLLSALVNAGADYLSNDDLVVGAGAGGGLCAHGSPRTLALRTDSLLALAETHPNLRLLLAELSHPANRHWLAAGAGEAASAEAAAWVRPHELAAATGCRLVGRSRVHTIVFPRFDLAVGPPRLSRLDRADAAQRLNEHVENEGTRYDPFLRQWFPTTDAARRSQLANALLDLPCFELCQHLHRLKEGSDLLLAALAADP